MAHYNRPLPTDDPRHGTYAGYSAGCLQPCCRRAFSRYRKRLRHDWARGVRRTVDPTGFRRRVDALRRLGWPLSELATRIGTTKSTLSQSMRVTNHVTLDRHMAMMDLYRELSDRPGPNTRTRLRAERLGYPPPIAWDDDTIDDPQARPYAEAERDPDYFDPALVERILRGDWRLKGARRADRIEVMRRHTAAGGSDNGLAELTGWNVGRDRRWLQERQRSEVTDDGCSTAA